MSGTSRRGADRASRLARAAALSGTSGKVCPADRATLLLEAIIEPGAPRLDAAGDWKGAFAERSASAFADAFSDDVVLEGSTLNVPIVGRENVKRVMPFVLSIVAGSVDVIGFLALDGLFTAHITGNIVVLAVRFVAGGQAALSHLLALPVFMLVLGVTRLLVAWLEHARIPSLLPLLLLELLLLSGFLAIALTAGRAIDPNAASMVCAGMLGVAAMAVQNALVRISLTGAPSTGVMTTNVTSLAIDVGEILLAPDASRAARARERARDTGTAIAGFVVGCALGAAGEHFFGLRSLVIPIGFASIALVLGLTAAQTQSRR